MRYALKMENFNAKKSDCGLAILKTSF